MNCSSGANTLRSIMGTMSPSSILDSLFAHATRVPFDQKGRYVIFSDLHMGDGGRSDEFRKNARLFENVLRDHYLQQGYTLILNGDIEELQKFSLSEIRSAWPEVYGLFDHFEAGGNLLKVIGNHDAALLDQREGYPYPLHEALLFHGDLPCQIFISHGHHASTLLYRAGRLVPYLLRYVLKPLGLKNLSYDPHNRRRYSVEKRMYSYSRRRQLLSVIGHTHRPLFESIPRADSIKHLIDRLLRAYQTAEDHDRTLLERQIESLYREYTFHTSNQGRFEPVSKMYSTDFPVPCLFNTGCAIGKRGFTCIEIDQGSIALVHWSDHRIGDSFRAEGYQIHTRTDSETQLRKVLLRKDDLRYVMNAISILGRMSLQE